MKGSLKNVLMYFAIHSKIQVAVQFRSKSPLLFFLILVNIITVLFCKGQDRNIPISKASNLEILNYHEDRAREFVAKNLNRFAYERLQKYDALLDSLYVIEKRDTLAFLENDYLQSSASRISTIDKFNRGITEQSALKDKYEKQYWSLVRKALLSFALWLTIVLILLQFRKSRLKKLNAKLQSTNIQLQTIEGNVKESENMVAEFSRLKGPVDKLNDEFKLLINTLSESTPKTNVPPELTEILSKSNLLAKSIDAEDKILNAALIQNKEYTDEKVLTDINDLCEQHLEIARKGFLHKEDINCQVVRDFEKKLSTVKIKPQSVGKFLLNFF